MRYTFTFSSVYPRCIFTLIAFEIRSIGRVLLVLGSRLKNDTVKFHCMLLVASGHHHYNKMQLSDGNYLSGRE